MRKYDLSINGRHYKVHVKSFTSEEATLRVRGKTYTVKVNEVLDSRSRVERKLDSAAAKTGKIAAAVVAKATRSAASSTPAPSGSAAAVKAPIPGAILEILVKEGDAVSAGQVLLKMEAMKMENDIKADAAGTVKSILIAKGDAVAQGQDLVVIE